MKILRFGISDDVHGSLPAEERSWHIAARKLEAATGQTWETVLRRSWPSSSFADDVEAAMAEEQPDLVALFCAAFWVSYPSSPLKLHRSRFPGSQQLARAGFWAASKPVLAHRGLFHAGRRLVTRSLTSEFFFEPDIAAGRVEQALRAILRHEDVALAVRGPLPLSIAGSPTFRAMCERRRAALDQAVASLCLSLRVEYAGFGLSDSHPPDELAGDRIHVNARGHARRAEHEFDVMLRAWREHRSGDE